MKILGFGNSTGAKFWRLEHPFRYLRRMGHEAVVSDEGITEQALEWADIVVLNSIIYDEGIALVRAYQKEKGLKLVVDCDDWFDLNPDSPFIKEHEVSSAKSVIKWTMERADLVTCSTKYLAERLKMINKNVKVLPNFLDMEFWDVKKYQNTSDKIRIGWAGSITHFDDLKIIIEPIKRIHKAYPNTEFIFIGDTRIADLLPGIPVETMLGVPFEVWPSRLSGMRLDIALAPLQDTPFNRAKSNIKWQEYSIAKIPGVYSPTVYKHEYFEPKFGLIAETQDEWFGAIEHYINYPQRREEVREDAYSLMKAKYSLEKHANEWVKAYLPLLT